MPGPVGPTSPINEVGVELLANVSLLATITAVPAWVTGVGLLRTEHLWESAHPSFSEQRRVYSLLFQRLARRPVVVRTVDRTALPSATCGPGSPSPLAPRGIALDMLDPTGLDVQLAAIADAAAGSSADVRVMAPMVALVEQAQWFADRARGHGLDHAGAMIEVPAAALCADLVLSVVSFASIGTNDLAQFAFAADREMPETSTLLDPWQPALLRMIQMVVRSGARLGKPVGVCGEAAADPMMAVVLAGLDVTSLSMPVERIPTVKNAFVRFPGHLRPVLADVVVHCSTARSARATAAAAVQPGGPGRHRYGSRRRASITTSAGTTNQPPQRSSCICHRLDCDPGRTLGGRWAGAVASRDGESETAWDFPTTRPTEHRTSVFPRRLPPLWQPCWRQAELLKH